MSKLFRARQLDANKSLPVFREEELPDLSEFTTINRQVPQMPTGMEKEEESVSIICKTWKYAHTCVINSMQHMYSASCAKLLVLKIQTCLVRESIFWKVLTKYRKFAVSQTCTVHVIGCVY